MAKLFIITAEICALILVAFILFFVMPNEQQDCAYAAYIAFALVVSLLIMQDVNSHTKWRSEK